MQQAAFSVAIETWRFELLADEERAWQERSEHCEMRLVENEV